MKRGVIALGVFMFLFGLSGMADAITGQGSFMVSVVVFAIGFGINLYNYIYGGTRKR